MAESRLCSIPDCGKAFDSHGYCSGHAHRLRRHGDPLAGGTPTGAPHSFLTEAVLGFTDETCLIWPFSKTPSGYGQIRIDRATKLVSRVVCQEVNGPPPTKRHEAAHSCGKGSSGCVNPTHLRWATPAENQNDRIAHGTSNRGERCAASKITRQEVLAIRNLLGTMPQKDIAAKFGVSVSHITAIKKRDTWAHLP